MKNIFYTSIAILLSLTSGFSQVSNVSDFDKKFINWHRNDASRKVMGTNTQKAYDKLLKGKSPKKKIIVAVIDAGVDINHEDLKSKIWVNKDEITGNGKDDDNNGYIDDVNGWNFLGNSKGENIGSTTLEKTRILRDLREKYRGKKADDIKSEDKEEYDLYIKLKKENRTKIKELNKQLPNITGAKNMLESNYKRISSIAGKKIETVKDIEDFEPKTEEGKELKTKLIAFSKMGLTKKYITDYYDYLTDQKKHHYNTGSNVRKDIIGDDLTDITDNNYGNPDVTGPDAFHGTFCSGIIGAILNNNIGIDGIADNVEIMPIRAVPNGDEYDKDVALAIRYAVDNGAQVINMSFGKAYSPQKNLVDDAIKYAESKGVLLVLAAGNDNKNTDIEKSFPTDSLNTGKRVNNLICVGASTIFTRKSLPASFSNYGNKNVDVFAPGQDVISTCPDNKYDKSQGTSFSAPVVSGVAALVWSYYPTLTASQLKEIIIKSATNKGRKKVYIPGTGKKTRFKNLSVSDGVVNAYEALILAEKMTNSN